MQIPFTKMAGAGNDFIIVDARRHQLAPLTRQWPAISRSLCDRHTGIGADGLLVLEMSRRANVKMRVFNSDGSEAEMCGNGARCVARYIAQGARGASVSIETRAGVVEATVRGDEVAMRMMDPTGLRLGLSLDVGGRTVRLLGFVNTGVPHAVVPVKRIDSIDVTRIGRALRYHRAFAPRGSNVNFVQADAKRTNRLRVRTYERGVEEETLACGTGVAASAVLYALRHEGRGRGNGVLRGSRSSCRRRIEVETRSGEVLTVAFTVTGEGSSRRVSDVVLQGAAARVFEGEVSWSPRRRT
ncbi:MAG: diaminopimelate epimerase [Candidatus Omnitrophica bacterium]|nr:diaminopimelate epimerase [Candidatus Omnitrophota bacterium]